MPGTTLNGEFVYVLIVAVIDAAILSAIALVWYRGTIARIMARPVRAPVGEPATGVEEDVSSGEHASWPADADPVPLRRRLTIAYGAGAVGYGTVIGAALTFTYGNLVPAAFVSLIWAHTWLVWPSLTLLLALNRKESLRVLAVYLLAGTAAVALVTLAPRLMRGTFDWQFLANIYWAVASLLIAAAAPLLLVGLTALRRTRGVLPAALAGTIVFGVGLMLFRRLVVIGFNDVTFRMAMLDLASWVSTTAAFYSLYFLMALPLAWLAWRALRWLAYAYGQKRFSDTQLIVDCWFAVTAACTIAVDLLAPYGLWGIGIGIGGFATYRLTVAVVLTLMPMPTPQALGRDGVRLLLLRVFGYQRRTEALFDQITGRWRLRGPVQLIGAADLAARTADPGDMLGFVEGRIEEHYVRTVDEVPRRVRNLDLGRDPDGRFRVNDIYCLNDTWQRMFQTVLTVTDRVVMDLRGFSQTRSGCRFELQQLATRIPADRIVLVTDQTTDEPLLRSLVPASVSIVTVDGDVRAGMRRVMERLTPL